MSTPGSHRLIGCHASVWTGQFDAQGLEAAFRGTAEAGFDLIELPMFAPRDWDVARTAALAAEYDLAISASLGLTDEVNISSEDEDTVRRGEEHLTAVLRVLHELGSSHLCGVIYGPMQKHMRPATELEVRNGQAALGRLAATAEGLGLRMGLEIVNRYETNILNTAAQAVDYVTEIGAPNLGVHLDTYHMNIEEEGMRKPVLAAARAGKLGYVHVGESNRGPLGTGTTQWADFWTGLTESGYDGIVTFESFSSRVVHPSFSNSLAIWRNMWDDNQTLATDALAFIRQGLAAGTSALPT